MRIKDSDLINCTQCNGKGFKYVETIYRVRDSLIASFGMVDVTPEDCETCGGKGLVIAKLEKGYAK